MHDETRKKRSHISTDVFINRTISAEGLDLSADGMYIYTRHQFIVESIIDSDSRLRTNNLQHINISVIINLVRLFSSQNNDSDRFILNIKRN